MFLGIVTELMWVNPAEFFNTFKNWGEYCVLSAEEYGRLRGFVWMERLKTLVEGRFQRTEKFENPWLRLWYRQSYFSLCPFGLIQKDQKIKTQKSFHAQTRTPARFCVGPPRLSELGSVSAKGRGLVAYPRVQEMFPNCTLSAELLLVVGRVWCWRTVPLVFFGTFVGQYCFLWNTFSD